MVCHLAQELAEEEFVLSVDAKTTHALLLVLILLVPFMVSSVKVKLICVQQLVRHLKSHASVLARIACEDDQLAGLCMVVWEELISAIITLLIRSIIKRLLTL